jgi:hypothetical protein
VCKELIKRYIHSIIPWMTINVALICAEANETQLKDDEG